MRPRLMVLASLLALVGVATAVGWTLRTPVPTGLHLPDALGLPTRSVEASCIGVVRADGSVESPGCTPEVWAVDASTPLSLLPDDVDLRSVLVARWWGAVQLDMPLRLSGRSFVWVDDDPAGGMRIKRSVAHAIYLPKPVQGGATPADIAALAEPEDAVVIDGNSELSLQEALAACAGGFEVTDDCDWMRFPDGRPLLSEEP